MQQGYTAPFLQSIAHAEVLCNATMSLTAPYLYDLGCSAIVKLQAGMEMSKPCKNVELWPSIFSAMQVIVNRQTGPHRDKGGCPSHYDLLVSVGTHNHAAFKLPELGLSLLYNPGAFVVLVGKVFLHEVMTWEGGERICVAHFMKDAVHNRLQLPRPQWPIYSMYLDV